jgi:plasmid stability protein
LAEKLRKRAKKSHRSLQGELMTILEESLEEPRPLSAHEAIQELRRSGLKTKSDPIRMVRDYRDKR